MEVSLRSGGRPMSSVLRGGLSRLIRFVWKNLRLLWRMFFNHILHILQFNHTSSALRKIISRSSRGCMFWHDRHGGSCKIVSFVRIQCVRKFTWNIIRTSNHLCFVPHRNKIIISKVLLLVLAGWAHLLTQGDRIDLHCIGGVARRRCTIGGTGDAMFIL